MFFYLGVKPMVWYLRCFQVGEMFLRQNMSIVIEYEDRWS